MSAHQPLGSLSLKKDCHGDCWAGPCSLLFRWKSRFLCVAGLNYIGICAALFSGERGSGMRNPGKKYSGRDGLTILELLVAITIIGFLVALGAGAGYRVVESVRVSSTENAIRIIDKVLAAHWK